MWSLRTLTKVSAYGTFGIVGVILLVHEEIQARIRKSTCYTEAFEYLRGNSGAVKYFGEPLKTGYINNLEEPGDQSDSVLLYKVPLRGPNGNGSLYYKAVKEENWSLSRVELEVDKLPGRKFLIMEMNKATDAPEVTEDIGISEASITI